MRAQVDQSGRRDGNDGFAEIVVAAELSGESLTGVPPHAPHAGTVEAADAEYRRGMLVAAGFLLVSNLGFATFQSVLHPSEADTSAVSLLVRAAVDGIVLAILWWLPTLSRRGLSACELFLFTAEMFVLLDSQYVTGIQMIDRGDLVDAVAFNNNGVLRAFVLMFCNAVFLPHGAIVAGRVAVTMAAALVVCHSFVLEHARTAHLVMDDVASHQVVMFNAAALVGGAVRATLAGWHLRGRRDRIAAGGQVGPYQLRLLLDEGGMGKVYLAEHKSLARPCAVKVLPASGRRSRLSRERFARELRAASLLRHPSAVTVYDCGLATDGSPYYAMEFLPGLTVAGLVERFGPLPAPRAVYLTRQVCGVLEEAHRYGLVHQDLSPSNVFVAVLGGVCDVAKLLDFGVVAASAAAGHPVASDAVSGTPAYSAPEQLVRSASVDARADVYGVGALLACMLTGHPPYEGTTKEIVQAHLSEPLLAVERRLEGVPADLKALLLRCLARDPDERFPSAAAFSAALAECDASQGWDAEAARGWWQSHLDE